MRSARGRFVLRGHCPGYHGRPSVEAELQWLTALRRDTGLSVPEPVPTREGRPSHQGERRVWSLLRWVEGRRLPRIGRRRARQLGALMASLHAHSARWLGSAHLARPTFSTEAFGRYLFAPHDDRGWRRLSVAERGHFERVLALGGELETKLASTYGGFGLIHADVHRGNLLAGDHGLGLIDFDDCLFGPRLYDLAVVLESTEARRQSALGDALTEGYDEAGDVSALGLEHLDTMIALRSVFVALFVCAWTVTDSTFEAGAQARVERAIRHTAELIG